MSVQFDKSQWDKALVEIAKESKSTLSEILNRKLFFVMAKAFGHMDPVDPAAARANNRAYLNQVLAVKIKIATTGRRAGKFVSTGARHSLRRINLIVQRQRLDAGLPALNPRVLGADKFRLEMKAHSKDIRRSAISGVGYLKSAIAQVAESLSRANGYSWKREKRHRNAKGGSVSAKPANWNPVAEAWLRVGVTDKGAPGADARYTSAINQAMSEELKDMQDYIARKLQPVADKHNP